METKIKKLLKLLAIAEKLIIRLISLVGWLHILIEIIKPQQVGAKALSCHQYYIIMFPLSQYEKEYIEIAISYFYNDWTDFFFNISYKSTVLMRNLMGYISTKVNRRYIDKNYSQWAAKLRKEVYSEIEKIREETGLSRAEFLKMLVSEKYNIDFEK